MLIALTNHASTGVAEQAVFPPCLFCGSLPRRSKSPTTKKHGRHTERDVPAQAYGTAIRVEDSAAVTARRCSSLVLTALTSDVRMSRLERSVFPRCSSVASIRLARRHDPL